MTKEEVICRMVDAKLGGMKLWQTSFSDGRIGAIYAANSAAEFSAKVSLLPSSNTTVFYWIGSPVMEKRTELTLEEATALVEKYWSVHKTGENVTGYVE